MIPVVRCRPSVRFQRADGGGPLAPAGIRILAAIDGATKVLATDLWVSCGVEGHKPDDPHSLGEALDVSVRDLTTAMILRAKTYLEQVLGAHFTVLYECPEVPRDQQLARIAYVNPHATGNHLHLQRKKDTQYPPQTLNA